MMIIENNLIPKTWIFTTIPNLICCDGIVSDGDWVESKDQDPNGMVRLIQLADIGDDKYLNKSARFLTLEKAKELNCTFLNKGDILVARMPDPLGRACIFPGDEKICVTVVDVCIIRSGARGIDHNWLMSVINSPQLRQEIIRMSSGTTRKRISKKNLSEMPIPLAPLNEQRRIVAKIEALKARSQRVKEELEDIPQLLDQFRQSVLAAAFRGDLTADWREQNPDITPVKKLLIKSIQENSNILPETWDLATVGDVIESLKYGTSQKCSYEPVGVPVLRIPNIGNGIIEQSDLKYADLPKKEFEELKLVPGDILIIRSNGSASLVGKSAVVKESDKDFTYAGYLIRLRLNQLLIDSNYLNLCFSSHDLRLQIEVPAKSTSGVHNINSQEVKQLRISIAPLEEQKEIVRRIKTFFKSADIIQQQYQETKAHLDQLDQSILAKAFRGELVPQDPDDEPASVLLERIRAERAKLQTKTAKKSTTQSSARRTKKTQPQQEESVQLELGLE